MTIKRSDLDRNAYRVRNSPLSHCSITVSIQTYMNTKMTMKFPMKPS